MSEEKGSSLTEGCKNKHKIVCERCQSVILLPEKAIYIKKECKLPNMKKKTDPSASDVETLEDFWVVDDMFTFENVGFSNTVEGKKYLVCADCEVGPIGYQDVSDAKAFYIAINRVKTV